MAFFKAKQTGFAWIPSDQLIRMAKAEYELECADHENNKLRAKLAAAENMVETLREEIYLIKESAANEQAGKASQDDVQC